MSRGVVLEQNSSRRDGREFGQTMNKNYRHKRCARSCAARASKKKIKKKTKSNIISLTVLQKKTKRKRCACSSAGGASKGIVEKASGSRTPLFFQGGGCQQAVLQKPHLFSKGVDCMHSVFVFVCGPKVSLIFSNNMT